ncbi:MAG: hypothetical protein ACXV3F_00315 [Frankiaceae bacterium]
MSTFTYFGEEFTFAEEPPFFAEAEFFEMLERDNVTPREAMATALRLAMACVAEKDRPRFRSVSRQHNAKSDDWLKVYNELIVGQSERPTGLPADSSDGHEETAQSSGSQPTASVTSQDETVRPIRPDMALALSRSA